MGQGIRRVARALSVATLALSLALPVIAEAKEKHHGKGKQSHDSGDKASADHSTYVAITSGEITIIYDYIRRNGTGDFGPPQGLPPGIAKNLARGKPLPPGIAKRHLPGLLVRELPERPGYQWLVVDRDVLLIAAATTIIVDILKDAL